MKLYRYTVQITKVDGLLYSDCSWTFSAVCPVTAGPCRAPLNINERHFHWAGANMCIHHEEMRHDPASDFSVFHIERGHSFQLVESYLHCQRGNSILMRPLGRNVSAALFEVESNRLKLKWTLALILEFMNIKLVLRGFLLQTAAQMQAK